MTPPHDPDGWNLGRRVLFGLALFALFHVGLVAAVWRYERTAPPPAAANGLSAEIDYLPDCSPAAALCSSVGEWVGWPAWMGRTAWATGRVVASLRFRGLTPTDDLDRITRDMARRPGLTNLTTAAPLPPEVFPRIAAMLHLRRWTVTGARDVSPHLAVAVEVPTLRVLVLAGATLTPADTAAFRRLRHVVTVVLLDCRGEPPAAVRAAMPWAVVAASTSAFVGLREEDLR